MTVVDGFASRVHYLDAMAGVWRALSGARGHLYTPPSLAGRVAALGLTSRTDGSTRGDTILTASWADARTARRWSTVALMEHGVGQTYEGRDHPAYAGGPRCRHVDLFLCPNQRVADANRAACPGARVEVIGSPWLDTLAGVARYPDSDLAVSFHWDCCLDPDRHAAGACPCPETHSTVEDWWPAAVELARGYRVLGHGHPRAQPQLLPRWLDAGVEPVARFEDVVARARVFAADSTSCLYYAAALGMGVVVLDSPAYRRDVEHGLRFWEMADVGHRAARPEDLPDAVARAITGPTARAAAIVDELFPWRGRAVERAVAALVGHGVS